MSYDKMCILAGHCAMPRDAHIFLGHRYCIQCLSSVRRPVHRCVAKDTCSRPNLDLDTGKYLKNAYACCIICEILYVHRTGYFSQPKNFIAGHLEESEVENG